MTPEMMNATGITPEMIQTTRNLISIIIAIGIWEMIWKGFALWKAGTKKQIRWFICIFILNTAGILPIIYLIISKFKEKKSKK